jgi:hypothetical protein
MLIGYSTNVRILGSNHIKLYAVASRKRQRCKTFMDAICLIVNFEELQRLLAFEKAKTSERRENYCPDDLLS